MDINENIIKEEVGNLVTSLQKLLPKKKDIVVLFETKKQKLTRLSDIHAEAKSVFPNCFIGAKLVILRDMVDKVKLIQQYNYGKPKESYKSFAQLLHKELEPKEEHDGLLIDSSGSATAIYKEKIEGDYEMRLTSKIKDLVSSETEIVLEKENQRVLGSVTCAMKDVDPNTLRFVTQWTYRVLPEFFIGGEFGLQPLVFPLSPELSASARYERPSFSLSSTISRVGFQVCLYKQFAPDLRIATIVNEGYKGDPATVGLALHKSYQNGSDLKIFVDSQRCGGFTFQKDVMFHQPHNEVRVIRLVASTLIDRQRRVRFGFGFNLDF
ncbi:uncharacterized protein [Epargyreus clarus]|uniref:uncharacterized protein n=1 Tax=Epargyreus clarus TaxID=520877 RepID=UPI003C2D3AC6